MAAAINTNGEMLYWDGGFPFGGILQGSNVNSELLFWDGGFPYVYMLPTPTTGGQRMWGYIIF